MYLWHPADYSDTLWIIQEVGFDLACLLELNQCREGLVFYVQQQSTWPITM